MSIGFAPPARASASHLVGRLAVVAVALTVIGCRNNDASQRDAYIRELRMHESRIYEMQDNVAEYQELLRCQRMENARLRKQVSGDAPLEAKKLGEDDDDAGDSGRSLLDRPAPDDEEDEDIDSGLPQIDLGDEELPQIELGNQSSHEGEAAGETRLASATVFAPPPRPMEQANSCAIYAEQVATEPGSTEGGAGESVNTIGLMAIVEPLTSDGAAGNFTGQVSLMLVDPVAGEEGHWKLARWDYTAEEVEAGWRDISRRVLDLPLAVPNSAPRGRPLELWVRLIPQDSDLTITCSTTISLAEQVALIGVPVSGGQSSTDPAARVTSGWAAADELGTPSRKLAKDEPAAWQAATSLPPAAIATATAGYSKRTNLQAGETKTAKRTPDWSPFRK